MRKKIFRKSKLNWRIFEEVYLKFFWYLYFVRVEKREIINKTFVRFFKKGSWGDGSRNLVRPIKSVKFAEFGDSLRTRHILRFRKSATSFWGLQIGVGSPERIFLQVSTGSSRFITQRIIRSGALTQVCEPRKNRKSAKPKKIPRMQTFPDFANPTQVADLDKCLLSPWILILRTNSSWTLFETVYQTSSFLNFYYWSSCRKKNWRK